jgi:hypothetical protein
MIEGAAKRGLRAENLAQSQYRRFPVLHGLQL